jgi:hypothetical protein
MAAPIFQRTIVDSNGNVEIGASVEVRNEANNELAPIFVDRDLTVAKANPFTTDETGLAKFFVAGGEYKVTATKEENVIVWRYVQMIDTDFVASTDTEQTLTNKTLISPQITTPTGIVKGDVGLGNVDNTEDSDKVVASAAKLTTARTIGGVSFDGTANINLPGVNAAGNQNTTGTAANVTGTVAVANGGTGITSAGASGNVLTSNGTAWVSSAPIAGGMTVSATAPSGPADGNFWYDTTKFALNIYYSGSWRSVTTYV